MCIWFYLILSTDPDWNKKKTFFYCVLLKCLWNVPRDQRLPVPQLLPWHVHCWPVGALISRTENGNMANWLLAKQLQYGPACWHHHMKALFLLLAFCEGIHQGLVGSLHKGPVTERCDVFIAVIQMPHRVSYSLFDCWQWSFYTLPGYKHCMEILFHCAMSKSRF